MRLNEIDLTKEFEFEHSRCQNYIDYMYRTLQFSFAAIIAIVGVGFTIFNKDKELYNYMCIIFAYVLPVCMYVFGVLYAYNAYVLAICGQKAELIHSKIYSNLNVNDDISKVLKKYVVSNRIITALSYGVPLGFYLAIPAAGIAFSIIEYECEKHFFFYNVLPIILFVIYFAIMLVILINTGKHFAINKIQKQ